MEGACPGGVGVVRDNGGVIGKGAWSGVCKLCVCGCGLPLYGNTVIMGVAPATKGRGFKGWAWLINTVLGVSSTEKGAWLLPHGRGLSRNSGRALKGFLRAWLGGVGVSSAAQRGCVLQCGRGFITSF